MKELISYIDNELRKGFTPIRIRNHLYQHGFDVEKIDSALKKCSHSHGNLMVDRRFDITNGK